MIPRVAAFAVLVAAAAPGIFGAGQPVCKLAWDPSPDPAVTEVVLYYGTKSRSYYSSNTYPVGVTNAAVSNLTVGVVYYFAVTARNRYGVESEYSNEVVLTNQVESSEIVVDDPEAVFVGAWGLASSVMERYGSAYRHDGDGGKGSKSATFKPTLPRAGDYEVYIQYAAAGNRATNVSVDVVHAGGTKTVTLNQKLNGGKWNLLGAWNFSAGAAGYVRIRNAGTSGYVIADAVKWVPVVASEIVVDDPEAVYVGTWGLASSVMERYGSAYRHDGDGGKGSKSATFQPTLPRAGWYEVYVQYPAAGNRATNVSVDVVHAGGTKTVKVNQRINGGKWNLLGTWSFSAGAAGYVRIRNAGTSGYVIADAVKWVPVEPSEIVVDDPAAAYVGTWGLSSSVVERYGSAYRHDGDGGKGSKSATFKPTLPRAGNYEVYVQYAAAGNRATNVPVDVVHAGGTKTVKVNQRVNGGKWNLLGTWSFSAGAVGYVRIRNAGTSGYVIADAVKWVPVASSVSGGAGDLVSLASYSSLAPTVGVALAQGEAGRMTLQWATESGVRYQVYGAVELGAPWEMIHETIGDGSVHSWEVSPPWMFFRVATGQAEGEQRPGGENW